ncbi:hypothetical protein MNB_SV-14-222 [hydrothermal vent metagenome]|uniref:Uncharacterized protein n=1 Tax=hydrothermal vent metagenome TaxID=652676 RepID=A0A1W1BI29_9ZZZZ
MEEFFVIGKRKLDKSWSLNDLYEPNNAFDYCEQILDIPEEYILDANMTSEGLEITLGYVEDEEDWYIQLKRVSQYNHILKTDII